MGRTKQPQGIDSEGIIKRLADHFREWKWTDKVLYKELNAVLVQNENLNPAISIFLANRTGQDDPFDDLCKIIMYCANHAVPWARGGRRGRPLETEKSQLLFSLAMIFREQCGGKLLSPAIAHLMTATFDKEWTARKVRETLKRLHKKMDRGNFEPPPLMEGYGKEETSKYAGHPEVIRAIDRAKKAEGIRAAEAEERKANRAKTKALADAKKRTTRRARPKKK